MSDDTTPAPLPKKWVPWVKGGPSPNPAGRGHSPSKFSKKFLVSLAASWAEHGDAVLEEVRKKDAIQYLRICASLIPKQILIHNVESRAPTQLSEAELQAIVVEDVSRLEQVRAAMEPLVDRVAQLDWELADEMRKVLDGG
jgi:hypothetical protein